MSFIIIIIGLYLIIAFVFRRSRFVCLLRIPLMCDLERSPLILLYDSHMFSLHGLQIFA